MATVVCILLFFLTRVFFLGRLPIFNDESIYLHWGRDIVLGFQPWWMPVVLDGKPPGTMILFGIAADRFPLDPLIAARLVSVICSAGTILFSLLVFRTLFSNRKPFLFLLLLLCNPFLVFFDRLAIAESIMTMGTSMLLYVSLRFWISKRSVYAVCIGALLGIFWWGKATIMVFVPVLMLNLLILFFRRTLRFFTAVFVFVLVGIILFLCTFPLRIHPSYPALAVGSEKWIFTLIEIMSGQWQVWWRNINASFVWFVAYPTPFVAVCAVVGMLFGRMKHRLFFVLWFAVPVLFFVVFGKNFTARYLVVLLPVFSLFAWMGLWEIRRSVRRLYPAIVGLTVATSCACTFLVILFPLHYFRFLRLYPAAQNDFAQYVSGWTSGYGVKDALQFIDTASHQGTSLVFVREDSGNPEDVVFVYSGRYPSMEMYYLTNEQDLLGTLSSYPSDTPAFFISRGPQYAGVQKYLVELTRFQKPLDEEFVGVYAIGKPSNER